jgi:hypothetical protein
MKKKPVGFQAWLYVRLEVARGDADARPAAVRESAVTVI